MTWKRSSGLIIVFLSFAGLSSGQLLGSLVGTVRDVSGAVIPKAAIKAEHHQTGNVFERTADGEGNYVFDALPIGSYTIVFRASAFQDLRIEGVEAHVASVVRQDAVLQLASVSSTVQVESSTPLVKTETAEIGQLVDARQISELPLNGRDVFSLLTLSGGAETGASPAARFTTTERPALAGGRAGYTVFRINGIDVNSQNLPSASVVPSVDAVEEFRAITQLAPASESSTSTVSVAVKGGTNLFHGSAYDFLRNNVFDAHQFFERKIVTPDFQTQSNQLRYNLFGGSLGGPLRKNRTFFFSSVQFTREKALSQVTGIYPTAQMLQGDFSGLNPLTGAAMLHFGPLMDPATSTPFPRNLVPTARMSSFARAFLPVAFLPANCP